MNKTDAIEMKRKLHTATQKLAASTVDDFQLQVLFTLK